MANFESFVMYGEKRQVEPNPKLVDWYLTLVFVLDYSLLDVLALLPSPKDHLLQVDALYWLLVFCRIYVCMCREFRCEVRLKLR